jgi:hypothetical protein
MIRSFIVSVVYLIISLRAYGSSSHELKRDSDPLSREQLVAQLASLLPSEGTLRVEYERLSPPGRVVVAINWSDGSWFVIRPSPNSIVGRDSDGRIFTGKPHAVPLKANATPQSGIESFLDDYFPLIMLRGLLQNSDAFAGATKGADGAMRIEFSLPRGSRDFRIDELSAFELERWGGVQGIMRRVVVHVSADWRVTSLEREGETPSTIDHADCSKPGEQVSRRSIAFEAELVKCERNTMSSEHFSIESVSRLGEQTWPAPPVRTAVPSPDRQNEPPTPITQGGSTFSIRSSTFVIGGLVVIFIGIMAWYRSKVRQ